MKYLKLILVFLIIISFSFCIFIFSILWRFAPELPSYEKIINYKPNLSSRIYSSDGMILKSFYLEERIYRLRCVEAWSMVVPWIGFELNKIIREVKPLSNAKYVSFVSILDTLIKKENKWLNNQDQKDKFALIISFSVNIPTMNRKLPKDPPKLCNFPKTESLFFDFDILLIS